MRGEDEHHTPLHISCNSDSAPSTILNSVRMSAAAFCHCEAGYQAQEHSPTTRPKRWRLRCLAKSGRSAPRALPQDDVEYVAPQFPRLPGSSPQGSAAFRECPPAHATNRTHSSTRRRSKHPHDSPRHTGPHSAPWTLPSYSMLSQGRHTIYNYPASLVLRARDDDFSLLAFLVPTAPVRADMMKKTAR